ncbi:MAG: hypothetical protein U0K14_02745 [Eggerthellaceae bacterium]|nr:hypothetical protein [Eggerthellaceae bacterium]
MSYWPEDRLEAMRKIQNKKIRNRRIAIGLLIPELLAAITATIFAVLANDMLWIVIFALFSAFSVYVLIKQIQFLKEDLSWKPRDPRDYYKADKR